MIPVTVRSSQTDASAAIKRDTLDAQIYRDLRRAIAVQEIRAGDRLIHNELARKYGTSRIPIRDALRRLQNEGLVRVDKRGAYFVESLTAEDVEEIFRLRELLEPEAAVRAIGLLTAEHLEILGELVDASKVAVEERDVEQYIDLNEAFHAQIYAINGGKRAVGFIRSLWVNILPLAPAAVPGQMERSQIEHEQILSSLRAGDERAVAEGVRAHLANTREALQDHFLNTLDGGRQVDGPSPAPSPAPGPGPGPGPGRRRRDKG